MDVVRQSDFEEFQYGKDVFQTTTSGIVNSVSGYISNCKHLAMVT